MFKMVNEKSYPNLTNSAHITRILLLSLSSCCVRRLRVNCWNRVGPKRNGRSELCAAPVFSSITKLNRSFKCFTRNNSNVMKGHRIISIGTHSAYFSLFGCWFIFEHFFYLVHISAIFRHLYTKILKISTPLGGNKC